MTTAEPRRKRMPKEQRKAQMLDVAEQVFAERGYVAASMDEIAERVGVSKPMLYEYFGSKEGLLTGCVRRARAELLERTRRAITGADGPEEVLRRGLLAFFGFIADHRRSWSLLRQEAAVTVPAAVAEVEGIRRQQTDLIAAVFAGFDPGAAPVVAEAFAEVVVGAAERLALWCERRPEVGPALATDYVMDIVWHGVGRRLAP
ncbi:TetR/AcrR family transcriptional regulator [Saccharothrix obliqua]|uniref:TetR/AcrR family transcriptional regulator n=1 Tax=Saccharothrix obliqua TaxID=2861747 RepID=UPI001C5E7772|nr:TetR/AcrR family transcriptional regulator [Saccharothrix obliqua]MBW4720682.1 TetR/AcrR family transcriptional regulator [Saccharothrix obliqua]